MRSFKTRVTTMALAVLISISVMAGCGKSEEKAETTAPTTVTESTAASTAATSLLPVKSPVTLKYWCSMGSIVAVKNFSEMLQYQEMEKRTGVTVEFMHPVAGQEKEQLNIMIASGDIPDIIERIDLYYPNGVVKAFQDGVIIDLKDLQKNHAPNLTKIYTAFPQVNRDVETEGGQYLNVPMFLGANPVRIQWGGIMRKDWLDDVGMQTPKNLDEWTAVLKAFKDKKGAKVPLVITTAYLKKELFTGPFGITSSYFIDNGKVKYGPYEEGYKDYLTLLASWYKEGLIDSEFPTAKTETVDARILNSDSGAYYFSAGSGFAKYLRPLQEKDPKADLVAVEMASHKIFPVANVVANAGVSITSACKEKEIAMAWIDYGFSKEGHILQNFGVEGVSYKVENGQYKYMDIIAKNPESPMGTAGRKYARVFYGNGALVSDSSQLEQFLTLPQQKEALKIWSKYSGEYVDTRVKGTLTAQENQMIAAKSTEILTYVDEMFLKFVMGVTPLTEFEQYRAQLKELGVEDCLKTKQDAYERFVKKFPDELKSGGAPEVESIYK